MSPMLVQDKGSDHHYLWIKRWIAVLAVLNLALVFFHLTYLNARSLYLQALPSLVQAYDPIKGIRPHPETQRYLERVAALELQLTGTAVRSPEVEISLADLRSYSQLLIQDDPFPKYDNSTLETIKQELRSRTGADSSFVAFDRFWSQDHLAKAGWQPEIEFWNRQIRPLMAANYYRQVNRFGQSVDNFWWIDLPFIIIFAIDFAVRNRSIRRRYPELSWLESIVRRWYDLFLLIPIWQWLRVIPVTIRLHQVGLINLEPLQAEARRDFAIGFAKSMTEVVGVQAINQLQDAIRRGEVMQWILYPEFRREYIEVNDQNEIKAIGTRIADIVVYQVLPQIQPELETFIYYSLHQAFDQMPGYRQLQYVPGIGNLPQQTTERLTQNLSKTAYQSLVQIWEDPEIAAIATQLVQSFRDILVTELQKEHNTQEIENLLIDLLEEIKISYVQGITEVAIEQIVEEAEQLQRGVKA